MKFDIILAGVGGQGVLSVTAAIATAALDEGFHVKQSEVHGMSQRGGAVSSTLRMGDSPVESPLVSLGSASLVLSMEPLESLRYLSYLSPAGAVITSANPVGNIADYPPIADVLERIQRLPRASVIDAEQLARDAGSAKAANMVLVGACSRFLPLKPESLQKAIHRLFSKKGEKIVETNLKAFELGRTAR
ncbi:MAG TPA: indolepyruvate oxidoreductase subunit beta [Bdellovibrionota bacterium]|nr:indolepyruvate oxidoreductase subunit beta [Bdellovibrionota bacterium]